jgi:hypothetical protein
MEFWCHLLFLTRKIDVFIICQEFLLDYVDGLSGNPPETSGKARWRVPGFFIIIYTTWTAKSVDSALRGIGQNYTYLWPIPRNPHVHKKRNGPEFHRAKSALFAVYIDLYKYCFFKKNLITLAPARGSWQIFAFPMR